MNVIKLLELKIHHLIHFFFKKKAISSISIEEGIVSWYSNEDVYLERNKINIFDKINLPILKLRKKLKQVNRIRRSFK